MSRLNRPSDSSKLCGSLSNDLGNLSASSLRAQNSSCKKGFRAMVVKGGHLWLQCLDRGILEQTKRALNSARGVGEGAV